MKYGFDFHGVLDLPNDKFRELAKQHVSDGHDVHILTGSSKERFSVESKDLLTEGIHYTKFFSVSDYLNERGVKNTGTRERPMFDLDTWNATKGEYAFYKKLDVHYDDCKVYAEYFPKHCDFVFIKDGEIVY